jgi:lipoprotein-releasing system ATP-binding protein
LASDAPEPLVECRGVCRDLGGAVATRVLDRVDLSIFGGELVMLTGRSGSGKSTLLYLLGALDRPTRGDVLLEGTSLGALDDDARATLRSALLGFVFQFHFLLPELDALENVMLPALRRGTRPNDAKRRAADLLERVGLAGLGRRRPGELSGGQQQRVAIARALVNQPRLVLADEPTGSLDRANAESVMGLLESLVRDDGLTAVVVTHEQAWFARGSRRVELEDGRVLSTRRQNASITAT